MQLLRKTKAPAARRSEAPSDGAALSFLPRLSPADGEPLPRPILATLEVFLEGERPIFFSFCRPGPPGACLRVSPRAAMLDDLILAFDNPHAVYSDVIRGKLIRAF